MKIFFLSLFIYTTVSYSQTNFQQFVNAVNSAANDSVKNKLVDSFIVHARTVGIPYIEGNTANFLLRASATNVYLSGDMNGWASSSDKLQRLSTTNLFYLSKNYEPDARLDYKFIRDGTWILDPENPKTCSGGFGPNSELAMPNYIQPPEIKYYSDIPHGTLKDTTFFSTNLGNSRTVRVYLPPNYSATSDSFPMILFHDGLEYQSLASAHNILDYLISQNQIEPVIAVFVPPVNRTPEYAGNQMNAFTNFIVNELLPYIDSRYRTKQSPKYRATAGASNGGNIALWLGYQKPDVFGNVAAQSSNVISSISNGLQNSQKLNLKFYLDIGTYDISQLIPMVRNLKTILDNKGYEIFYREYHEGHSWGNWRAHIDDYLKFFFPKTSTDVKEKNINSINRFELHQNFPNPFNPITKIKFSILKCEVRNADRSSLNTENSQFVTLKVYDVLGQELETIVNEEKLPGEYEVIFDSTNYPSGIYVYRLSSENFSASKKMIVMK